MGRFYANLTLQTDNLTRVQQCMLDAGRTGIIAKPQHGAIVVFDADDAAQDAVVLDSLAVHYARTLGCAALSVIVHDDSLLMLSVFDHGEPLDVYISNPEYFGVSDEDDPLEQGGDAHAIARCFGIPAEADRVEALFRAAGETFVFETERHRQLMEILHTSLAGVGVGYEDLINGEYADGLTSTDYVDMSER